MVFLKPENNLRQSSGQHSELEILSDSDMVDLRLVRASP